MLKINDYEIIILIDDNSIIWFKFKDTLKALGYKDLKHRMIDMNINKNNKIWFNKIKMVRSTPTI